MQQDWQTDRPAQAQWTRPTIERLDAASAQLQGGIGTDTESEVS